MNGVVVQIEGSPLRLVYGEVPARAVGGDVQLASIPEPSGVAFDPDTGNATSSRMSVTMSAGAASRIVFLRTASRPLVTLAAGISAAATSLTTTTAISVVGGSYIWLGEEVMQVLSTSGTTVNVSRGLTGTAQAHSAGTFIWLGSPYWRRRRATMTVYEDGAPTGVWAGLVDGAPKSSSDATKITLDLCGIWTLARDIMSNRGALPSFTSIGLLSIGVSFTPAAEPVRANPVTGQRRVWHLAEALFTSGPGGVTNGQGLLDTPKIEDLGLTDAQIKRTPIYELFVAGRSFGPDETTMAGAPNPDHPIEIALALMGVHPDVQLSRSWVPGVAQFWTSAAVSAAMALAEQTADRRVDHVVLGWGGKPVVVLEFVRDLLRLWGLYLVEGANGLLTIVEYALADALGEYPLLFLTRDVLTWEGASGGAADRVVANVGALPFRAGANVSLALLQGQLAEWDLVGETLTLEAAAISLANALEVFAGPVTEAAYRRQRGQPTMTVRLRHGLPGPPALGAIYRLFTPEGLLTPIFPKADGTLTASLTGDAAFSAWVVGARWLPRLGTYELTLQLNNWATGALVRVRAPSGEVASASSAGGGALNVVLAARDWGQDGADQTVNWRIGQLVSVWSADGLELGDYGAIDGLTAPATLTIVGLGGAPAAGTILRLAGTGVTTQSPDAWNMLTRGDFYA